MNIRYRANSFMGFVAAMLISALACGGDGSTDPGGAHPTLALPLTDRIVFQSTRSDTLGDIFAMRLDGSDPIRLTGSESSDYCPAVSPDGNWIAYYSTPRDSISPGRGPSFVLMRGDGTDRRVIAGAAAWGRDFCPGWSPDSKSVTSDETTPPVTSAGGWEEVFRVYGTDGTLKSQFSGSNVAGLGLSSDGVRVLYGEASYSHGSVYDSHILVKNVDGSGAQILGRGSDPSWVLGGSAIQFRCDYSCRANANTLPLICSGLCQMTPDGATVTQISSADGVPFRSPDGNRIAIKCDPYSLCMMNANGSGFATIVSGSVHGPAIWFRNSSAIAFVCNSDMYDYYGAKNDICLVRPDGNGFLNLTAGAGTGADANPSVSPLSN